MRAVIQRVQRAAVSVNGQPTGTIGKGLLVLVGMEAADTAEDLAWLSNKLVNLRIFGDAQGAMNLSLKETGGGLLLVSQFTLHAATKKGNRPSFIRAARPELALPLYEQLIAQLERDLGEAIATGIFGADMQVELLNDGPVTIWIDTKARE
jgi:D-tyrosyl-tRNA(Tyr) deacylase